MLVLPKVLQTNPFSPGPILRGPQVAATGPQFDRSGQWGGSREYRKEQGGKGAAGGSR